jgi:hypothetical protein
MGRLKIILILGLFILTRGCLGQLADNFADGDFSSNPTWSGDNAKFIINAGKLKLQAPAANDLAFLSTSCQSIYNASWEFYLQMDFTPSSTNHAKIFLVSDQQVFNAPLNGYFVKAGNTSREVSLYRQSGAVETKIIDGLDDRLNVPIVKVKIKITRSDEGLWQLYSDAGITGTYSSEGSVTDNTFTSSAFFGVQCTYTSTRSDKFWFDDFVITGVPVPDRTPPTVRNAIALTQQQIQLIFSEELDASSDTRANFLLQNLGTPSFAELQPDRKTILIDFQEFMKNGWMYSLQVSGVKDLAGNTIALTRVNVLFFHAVEAEKKDIIFTEIFPDPSPQIGLPNAEFVEIYNRSADPFDLAGWKLSDGSSTAIFPSQIILPGEYWIATGNSSAALYSAYGKTLGLANFPTLNNGGDNITLVDESNRLIDSVNYSLEEYHDPDKQEGGWTLEIIDPNNPCGEQDNWTVSDDLRGGTPGKQNSVFANKPDLTSPELQSVFPEQRTQILISFNEKLDKGSLATENFKMNGQGEIAKAHFKDQSMKTVELDLRDTLTTRHEYVLEVKNIRDCSGNYLQTSSVTFGLPEKSDSFDIVINEILFNPRAGGVDFVEVYNPSEKYLNLKNWKVGNDIQGTPVSINLLFSQNVLLPPRGFAVFTTDPSALGSQYPQRVKENIWKTNLPSLPDDSGSLALLDDQGKILDMLEYSRNWHSEFIKNDEGVSLERISVNASTNSRVNWNSASSVTGYATPGYRNSQFHNDRDPDDGEVVVVPEIFSPAAELNEYVEIKYRLDPGGWVANVRIVDPQGRYLKTIANNETLASEGFFRWDGDRDDGRKARMGYYVVSFEAFNAEGIVKTFRKRVIVSGR